ncbi:MAG: hypothetical protein B6U72_01760 [Candidatus Altiarchaeales archaeon ex4484_2]|nr:MAG: hypothetical protein B6U72_01760 [Candidatus Altiarchaeales archaeon ex4484_2]
MKIERGRDYKVVMVLLLIIVFSTNVFSQGFLSGVWSSVKGFWTGQGLIGTGSFIGEGMGYFLRMILVVKIIHGGFMPKYAMSFPNNYHMAIISNPSPHDALIFELIAFFIRILQPVYVLLILTVGFYLLFMPVSPSSRSKAKDILLRLLVSMVVISLSIPIINLLLGLSEEMTESVFSLVSGEEVKAALGGAVQNLFWVYALTAVPYTDLGLPYLTLLFAMSFIPYIILGLRHILITLLMVLFPLGILFYTLPWFKGIGKKLLEQLIVWIFLQVFIALIIVVFVGIGTTIEEHVVLNAEISFTNLRGMYDLMGVLAIGPSTAEIGLQTGKVLNWWGLLLGGAIGSVVGVAGTEIMLHHFYEAMPATVNIVDFVLGATIYAMLIIFPLIWSHHLRDFLP